MNPDYWQRQTLQTPLFPDLLWSRPENRKFAGKLLIVGGNAQSFAAAATAYNEAIQAGIGSARVLLPDVLQRTLRQAFPEAEYAPSTPSGSLSRQATEAFLTQSAWADGVLLAGDLGRNSETAILLEQALKKYTGQLTITKDALDYFTSLPDPLLSRPATVLVLSFAQLQKIAVQAHFPQAFTFEMDLLRLIDQLHAFTLSYSVSIITKHLEVVCVASGGRVVTTKVPSTTNTWRVKTAAYAATWWLQNPTKTLEDLASAVYDCFKP